jgi:hypothetical protein
MQKLSRLPILFLLAGAALLVAASVWPRFVDPKSYWTDADAKARMDASGQYHGRAHQMSEVPENQQTDTLKKEFDNARTRYRESNTALAEAMERYERPIRLLRLSGIVCLTLGALGYVALRAARET